AASRYTMGRSAAIERRDALWALEGSVRFDHDALAVRPASKRDAFRTARLAHGNVAQKKRKRASEEPVPSFDCPIVSILGKNPMQRLYAGTWMQNRDGS